MAVWDRHIKIAFWHYRILIEAMILKKVTGEPICMGTLLITLKYFVLHILF